MTWLKGFTLLCAFAAIGELISQLLPFPFPGPIIGLLLLLIALRLRLISLKQVAPISDQLLGHLSLFFIPSGVGLMVMWPQIQRVALPLMVATIVSTLFVLAAVGLTVQYFARREDRS